VNDYQRIRGAIERIAYPGFTIELIDDEWIAMEGPLYLRVRCDNGVCNVTGKPMGWTGRKWRLSEYMTDGDVVQTAFMAVMDANEHETRELFTYRGVSVFDPHYDIEKLVELRRQPDALKEREAA
jgi:hypothetical protein